VQASLRPYDPHGAGASDLVREAWPRTETEMCKPHYTQAGAEFIGKSAYAGLAHDVL